MNNKVLTVAILLCLLTGCCLVPVVSIDSEKIEKTRDCKK